MKNKTKYYVDSLLEDLKNPKEAAMYLSVHLENDEHDAEELFLMALRDVAKAYGIKTIAKNSKLGRESLYKTLSKSGNPKVKTLRTILNTMGLELTIVPKAS